MSVKSTLGVAILAVGLALVPAAESAGAGPLAPGEADPLLDVSERYQGFVTDGRLDPARIEAGFAAIRPRLSGMRLLFVPSWLSDQARAASDLGVIDYMEAQIRALRQAGLAAEIAEVDSEASVPANARALERQIAAGRGPYCLISHSKGGLDTLEFLLRTDPATRAKVACWVALQAPFAGSPFADLASDVMPVRWMAREILTALGGSERSLLDLREDTRQAYLETFGPDIAALTATLPVLSFATYLEEARFNDLTTYGASQFMSWLAAEPLPNDGLVPARSAILPHSRYIVASGIDHNMTVTSNLLLKNPLDRVLLTKLLLVLVLTLDET